MNKKRCILIIGIVVFVILLSGFSHQKTKNTFKNTLITLDDRIISVEIASTVSTRMKGLSGREEIRQGIDGLLFVFEKEDRHGIWMKDMNFAIDILWFDVNKQLVHFEERVLPDTFPTIFRPEQNSLYVLEVDAGFVEKNDINLGAYFEFVY